MNKTRLATAARGLLLGCMTLAILVQAAAAAAPGRRSNNGPQRELPVPPGAEAAADVAEQQSRRLEDLHARRKDLPARIATAKLDAEFAAGRLKAAEDEVNTAKAEWEEKSNQAVKLRIPESEARTAWVDAAKAVEQAKIDARKAFDGSALRQHMSTALTTAEKALQAATDAVTARLLKTPSYAALVSAADAAEARLKELRLADPSSERMREVSKLWLEAKGQVGAVTQAALNADPAVAKARQALAKARADQSGLNAQVEAHLAKQPMVLAAQAALADRKKECDAAVLATRTALADADAAKVSLTAASRRASDAKSAVELAEIEATRLSQEDSRLAREQADAEYRLNDAMKHLGYPPGSVVAPPAPPPQRKRQ